MKSIFLCQTYIRCKTSVQIEELRSQVLNMGMDKLISSILAFSSAAATLP